MPAARNDEDIVGRLIDVGSAASTSGCSVGSKEREVYRCKICGHNEHARYAISRHIRFSHADQLRPMEANVRPQEYFLLGPQPRPSQSSSFATAEMNMAKLSSAAASSSTVKIEDSQLSTLVDWETLSNMKSNKSVQSEKLYVCKPCKELKGRSLAYESSEWNNMERHVRLQHASAVTAVTHKPSAVVSPCMSAVTPSADRNDQVDGLSVETLTADPVLLRPKQSTWKSILPLIKDGNDKLATSSIVKPPTKSTLGQIPKDERLTLPSTGHPLSPPTQGNDSPDTTVSSSSSSKEVKGPEVSTDREEETKLDDCPESPSVQTAATDALVGQAVVKPKKEAAFCNRTDKDTAALPAPSQDSAASVKRTKIAKRNGSSSSSFLPGVSYKSHRQTREKEKEHYSSSSTARPPPLVHPPKFARKSMAAQVFSLSFDSCQHDISLQKETRADDRRSGNESCGDEDRKITWLSLSNKVADQVREKSRKMTNQAAASLTENASEALQQKLNSNQTSAQPAMAPALASVEQQPEMSSQEEKEGSTEKKHQAEANGLLPDTPMDVQSDNVEMIASDSGRSSLSGPEADALHSAQPLDADLVRYLHLCSRMSGIALSEFYAHLTADNFRQAGEDVLLFRRAMGFNTAFKWDGE